MRTEQLRIKEGTRTHSFSSLKLSPSFFRGMIFLSLRWPSCLESKAFRQSPAPVSSTADKKSRPGCGNFPASHRVSKATVNITQSTTRRLYCVDLRHCVKALIRVRAESRAILAARMPGHKRPRGWLGALCNKDHRCRNVHGDCSIRLQRFIYTTTGAFVDTGLLSFF